MIGLYERREVEIEDVIKARERFVNLSINLYRSEHVCTRSMMQPLQQ